MLNIWIKFSISDSQFEKDLRIGSELKKKDRREKEILDTEEEIEVDYEGKMTTELEKLESVNERSQAIGEFLEWLLGTKNYHIAKYLTEEEYDSEDNVYYVNGLYEHKQFKRHEIGKEELMPIHIDIEKLLAEFFEIDLDKVEEERRKILWKIRG